MSDNKNNSKPMDDGKDWNKYINPKAKPLTPEQIDKLKNLKLPPPDFKNNDKPSNK